MPKQLALQNNFIGGLKTEFTGLNFPENACTATDNCVFSLLGDVKSRAGIDYEENYALQSILALNSAIASYRWKNAGGDGETEILVLQVGTILYFYESSLSTTADPLSSTLLTSNVNLEIFTATGGTFDPTVECQFADGNGYLFVYNKNCDPFYCTFSSGTITSNLITINIRDFNGIPDGIAVNYRPSNLSPEHQYNLYNQGWSNNPSPSWEATSTTQQTLGSGYIPDLGDYNFTVAANIVGIIVGESVICYAQAVGRAGSGLVLPMVGYVVSYNGDQLIIAATGINLAWGDVYNNWIIIPNPATLSTGNMNTWFNQIGNYPSNADQWWRFKDSTGAFNPDATVPYTTLNSGQAPQGYYVINPFIQNPSVTSGIANLTSITTTARPSTGCWSNGRVWYTGTNAAQPATGDQPYYTWTENIYFSQIITPNDTTSFGSCYQQNDPTSQDLFDLLPSDGGVITIQGCGNIYKLFPIQNGILVFASNGIWFITGSSGIGFTANDYTITKISNVQSISSHSFVNVLGYPIFWNEEGIYTVEPSQQQGFMVNPVTLQTIKSFYDNIPLDSKKYARGDYNPITYVIQWVYRSTEETDITSRYIFDSALNLNIKNQAFYPYTLDPSSNVPIIGGIVYMNYPSGSVSSGTAPDPIFKYITINGPNITFAEERDNVNWVDFYSAVSGGIPYTSYFETGYSLAGKGTTKWQPIYIEMFSRNTISTAYTIQGVWDYAISGDSGRWSSLQVVNNVDTNYGMLYRRHKIRGHGMSLQIVVSSVAGQPFDIMGWSVLQQIDQGV